MQLRRHIALVALLGLAACAEPTTLNPTFSKAELQREQQAQSAAVKQAQTGGTVQSQGGAGSNLSATSFDTKKKYDEAEVEKLAVRLAPIAERIEKASISICRDMRGPQANCTYKVILDPKEVGLNAHADGQNVVINPGMVDFATNDTHLAFVIAHEFAHNIMAHIAAQQRNVGIGAVIGTLGDALAQSQGIKTEGALGKLGANQALLRYSPSFETEADYVGLYILARAGYPIEQAPDFWRVMSLTSPDSIYVTSTHPNNPSRTITMEKTITEIRNKQAAGQPLLPNIRPKA